MLRKCALIISFSFFFPLKPCCELKDGRGKARQPLSSHFAHGELAGLGAHWVVAVLGDSCGAQCLKLSSNVWHMVCVCVRVCAFVCVSLWPVTLVALNYPVAANWSARWWGTGKDQSIKHQTCEQLCHQMLPSDLLRSPWQYLALASLENAQPLPAHLEDISRMESLKSRIKMFNFFAFLFFFFRPILFLLFLSLPPSVSLLITTIESYIANLKTASGTFEDVEVYSSNIFWLIDLIDLFIEFSNTMIDSSIHLFNNIPTIVIPR